MPKQLTRHTVLSSTATHDKESGDLRAVIETPKGRSSCELASDWIPPPNNDYLINHAATGNQDEFGPPASIGMPPPRRAGG